MMLKKIKMMLPHPPTIEMTVYNILPSQFLILRKIPTHNMFNYVSKYTTDPIFYIINNERTAINSSQAVSRVRSLKKHVLGNLSVPIHLKMGTERFPETLCFLSDLTQLTAREEFIAICHCKSFKSHIMRELSYILANIVT
jgi:hypothetical protein